MSATSDHELAPDTETLYVDGDSTSYDQVWDDRAALNYSIKKT